MLLSQFNRDLVHRRCIVKIGDEARVEKILGQSGLRKLRENLFVSLVNNSASATPCSTEEVPERPIPPGDPLPPGKAVPAEELIAAELLPPQGSVSPSGETVVLNHWSETIVLDKWGNPVPIHKARSGRSRGGGGGGRGGRGFGRGGGRSGSGVRGGGVRAGRSRGRPPLGGRPTRGRPPKRQQPPPVAAFFRAAGGLVRPRLRLRVTVSEGRYAVRDVSPDGADDGGGDGGGDLERAQRRARLINQPHVRAQVLAPLDATAAVGALLLTSDKAEYDGDDEEQQDDDASARPQPERDDEEQPLTKVNTTTAAATIAASSSPIKSVSEGEGKGDGRGTEAKGEEDPFPKKQRTTTAKEGIIDLAGIVAETIGDPESAVLNAPRPPASRLGRLVSDSLLSEPARDEDVIKGSEAIQEDRQASLCAAGVTAGGADKSSEALVIDSVGKETPLEKCSTSSTAKSVIESGKEKTDAKIRGGNSSETPVEKNEASGQPTRPAGNAQEGGSSRELQVKGEKRCDKSENIGEKKKSDIKEVKSEAKAPKEEVADDEDELPEEELDPLWITPPTSEPPSSPESIKIIGSEEEAEEDDKRVYKGKKKSTADSGPAAKHSEPQVKVKEGCKSSADNPAKEVVKAPSEKAKTSAEGTEEPAGPISKEGTGTADRESGQPETAEKRPSKSEIENRAWKSAPTSSEKRGDISEKAYSTLGKDITALTPGAEEVIAKPVCSKEARPSVGDVAGDRPELKSTAVEAVKGGGGAKRCFWQQGSAEDPGSPKSFGVCKVKRIRQSLQ